MPLVCSSLIDLEPGNALVISSFGGFLEKLWAWSPSEAVTLGHRRVEQKKKNPKKRNQEIKENTPIHLLTLRKYMQRQGLPEMDAFAWVDPAHAPNFVFRTQVQLFRTLAK